MEASLAYHTRTSSSDESSFDSEVENDIEKFRLKARNRRHHSSDITVPLLTKTDNGDVDPSENITYLDKYGATNSGAIENLTIQNLLNSAPYDVNKIGEKETKTVIKGTESSEQIEEEIITEEEEVVELEFENAIPKLDTHTLHCPNCDHHITKVVLRRRWKIINPQPPVVVKQEKPVDLLGCLSCLSLFTSSGNCFSILRVFGLKKDSKQPEPGNASQEFEQSQPQEVDKDFELAKPGTVDQDFEKLKPGKHGHPSTPTTQGKHVSNKSPIPQGESYGSNVEGKPFMPENQLPTSSVPSHQSPLGFKQPENHETAIAIPPAVTSPQNQVPTPGSTGQDSTSFEILKSIVYGGLMEVIASLSIVASAAAGDATTLNIIALALANLVGGIFVLGHNLWDLKDDCYKFYTEETSTQESRNKYKELLGSVEHFPMHAFFAIMSFLVFGIIPPVAYGYAFHETNDRDFTMVIVAVASFVCIGLLAIFKAYIDRCTGFSGYIKTILYYLTTAVTVSGVSYAAGNLANRLIEELGLFETGSDVAMAVLPEVMSANPALAYY